MNWLLVFVPVAIALDRFAHDRPLLVFFAAALAIVPLAAWMGRATEQLAERLGAGVGGLLNATFGNAAELTIAISALRAGLHDVVKASLAGAIIGNMLFVLGSAMLAGGVKRPTQQFNASAARSQATMLTLAVIALVVPAAYQAASGRVEGVRTGAISVCVAVVLLAVYAANLGYSLITHAKLFAGEESPHATSSHAAWSTRRAVLVLSAATAGIAWISEVLVGSIEPTAASLGLNDVFVGVFVLATLGGAAEQFATIRAARADRMDLAVSIAIGASVQVALFVAPLLVLLSYMLGPAPMDLAFSGGLVISILLSVLITGQISGDGRSDWLKGVQLLAVYLMLALAYYFVPVHG